MIGARRGLAAVPVAAQPVLPVREVRVGVEPRVLGALPAPTTAPPMARMNRVAGGLVDPGHRRRQAVVLHHVPSQHARGRMAIEYSGSPRRHTRSNRPPSASIYLIT